MAGSLKSWFLRNVLESAEREFGAKALENVSQRVAPRLRPHLSLDRLRSSAALDTVPLDLTAVGTVALLALAPVALVEAGKEIRRVRRNPQPAGQI